MSWGYRILSFYIVFIAGIGVLVIKSVSQNQDLVSTDYYEQELKFQEKIDAVNRANSLSSPVHHEVKNSEILITLPPEMKSLPVYAQVVLYCTADKSRDVRRNYQVKDGRILFPLTTSNRGLHELKISWTTDDINNYYFEDKLMIP